MCQTQLAKILRERHDSAARRREAGRRRSKRPDEALGDIRLQYEAHAEDLAKRIVDAASRRTPPMSDGTEADARAPTTDSRSNAGP